MTDQTMTFSYIVSATRPIGAFGLPALLALISVPVAEFYTQEPIRANLFTSLGVDATLAQSLFPVPPPFS